MLGRFVPANAVDIDRSISAVGNGVGENAGKSASKGVGENAGGGADKNAFKNARGFSRTRSSGMAAWHVNCQIAGS